MKDSFFTQFLNLNSSVVCENGQYKTSSMTECVACEAGKEPNVDKTACGKTLLWSFNVIVDEFSGKVNLSKNIIEPVLE